MTRTSNNPSRPDRAGSRILFGHQASSDHRSTALVPLGPPQGKEEPRGLRAVPHGGP